MTALAPVYRGDRLEAVVGMDVDIENLVADVLDMDTPWGGYGVLFDETGTVLAMPADRERDWLRQPTANHPQAGAGHEHPEPLDVGGRDRQDNVQNLAAMLKSGTSGVGHFRFHGEHFGAWATIPETGWRLLVLVPDENLHGPAEALQDRFNKWTGLLILGLIVVYSLFFAFLYSRARRMTRDLAEPLLQIEVLARTSPTADSIRQRR